MDCKKRKALLVLSIAALIAILISVLLSMMVFAFFPILIALVLFLIGMFFKWLAEWCVKNIHIFGIKEKALKAKEKLKVEKGVKLVKQSYDILKNKKGREYEE